MGQIEKDFAKRTISLSRYAGTYGGYIIEQRPLTWRERFSAWLSTLVQRKRIL